MRELPTDQPGRLLAGQIGKPHGTSGEVYVVRISDDPQRFSPGSVLIHSSGRSLKVATARAHRDRFLVRFEGIDERAAAETLRGALYVNEGHLRELADDEFWAHELVGAEVYGLEGELIGTVSSVVDNPAHDLLQISTSRGDVLLPVVKEFVRKVDVADGKIVVSPPEGLIG